jgi:hypothetical protein
MIRFLFPGLLLLLAASFQISPRSGTRRIGSLEQLRAGFLNPPDSARPGVYWYFMDGNLSKEAMTADLEAMKAAGIGNLVFLEVNVGVPRGKVNFLSEEWKTDFAHAVREAGRLGIDMTLGVGPGWTGSGGPWVRPEQSMQHLVSTATEIRGPGPARLTLPVPAPKKPFFGAGGFPPDMRKNWENWYSDVAVLAFPTPSGIPKIEAIDEKALYYRAPYTSQANVRPYFTDAVPAGVSGISPDKIIDLTNRLKPDGTLEWTVPDGSWTILRFAARNNGAVTRPAPLPGVGFEADKFDTVALDAHLHSYLYPLLPKKRSRVGGLRRLHMDSWEMGAQNWSGRFREEFRRRRGYDPLPYYPVYAGWIVGSDERSERFLWDLRTTAQELVLENHAGQLKRVSHRLGLKLSIEPYDMNPTADLALGAVADIPMCEFWSEGYGFAAAFSCLEATSIAHVNGSALVPAEAFTADHREAWKQHPGSMKNQGDWAFATGINRLVYHTFQHKYPDNGLRPGMTMGPYGVHWDRGQTWWPMVPAYHRYVSRCQFLLQQGRTVADILYLTPESAPHVFLPPKSALSGSDFLPDRRGYNFDGCDPGQLMDASVKDGRVTFPSGASYRMLVLPAYRTMTPRLLEKIGSLARAGATIVGNPPVAAPGLTDYPACDTRVRELAQRIWADGKIRLVEPEAGSLYPSYALTASLLENQGIPEDFRTMAPIRYTHRTHADWDLYFVSNRSDSTQTARLSFRATGQPQCWNPVTGEIRALPEHTFRNGVTSLPLRFAPHESFFIVFSGERADGNSRKNILNTKEVQKLNGPWEVRFDPKWGGPEKVTFTRLEDWTTRPENGIRYYSGIATYRKTFDAPRGRRLVLDLGTVKDMARVRLNGRELGVVWTSPWQIALPAGLKPTGNLLEIDVANRWPNRLIGDEFLPDDGIKDGKWPDWLLHNTPRTSGRFTFAPHRFYTKESPLLPSGLLGPVVIGVVE